MAQLIKHRTRDPKTRGSNPARSTRKKMSEFFRVKRAVLTPRCRCAQPPCVYARIRLTRTRVKYPIVHVRVQWITEARKDPARTLMTR